MKLSENLHTDDMMIKVHTKIETSEEKINTMKMCVFDKDEQIVNLEARVKAMESNYEITVKIQTDFKVLEKRNEENIQKIQLLMEKVSILEKSSIQNIS